MNYRCGEIKADVRVTDFETESNGLIRVRLSRWMRKPQIGDVTMVGDAKDEHVRFAEVVGFEGERRGGLALLRPTSEPFMLDDGWCDLIDE